MSALGPALPGARVLDLYAGSGALGLEALSRGASSVTFVERSRAALRCLEANVAHLGAGPQCRVVRGEALAFVGRQASDPPSFDLGLADPPYGTGGASELIERFLERPFASELWVEHRTAEPVPASPRIRHRRYGDTTLTTVQPDP